MRKDKNRAWNAQEPNENKRVADLSQVRARRKAKKMRRLLLWVIPLAVLLVWFTGRNSTALLSVSDFAETVRIGMTRGQGYPQQTGITTLYQWEEMTGGFVALGQEACVFYTDSGTRLNNVQAGYARPVLSAGDTRFVVYNRGGTELRVESRSKNLYTKSYTNSILLCEMGAGGSLAVVTDDPSYTAQMLVYPSNMEDPLTWKLTSSEGAPLRMAFSPNENVLAVATLSASGGQPVSRIFLLNRSRQAETLLAEREGSIPLAVEWRGDTLVVVYDDGIAAYQEKDGEIARFGFGGHTLTDYSMAGNGHLALLFNVGSASELVVLNEDLEEQSRAAVEAAGRVSLSKTAVYTCTETTVTCYSLEGEYLWHQICAPKAQDLLTADGRLLVFSGGMVQECSAPDEE